MSFGSTVPGKTSPRVKRILEVLFPEKTSSLIMGERSSAGPILPFFIFIFPGTVLPFCYFSIVQKVPEKPVLFLPHPHLSSFYFIGNNFCWLTGGQDDETSSRRNNVAPGLSSSIFNHIFNENEYDYDCCFPK